MKKLYMIGIIAAILLLSGCTGKSGSGISTDTIYGIEQDGTFCKTWSIWLTNDHPTGTKGEPGYYSAIYSVDSKNTELIKQLQDLAGSGQKVKIYYDNKVLTGFCDYSSDVVITKVEVIK
jgi:hypothetical protein